MKLPLEDLLQQEVTSVAKKPQKSEKAPAAVFVITQEDIRRSGATSLPDLLRMAPGMEVADLTSGQAAVAGRGFNGRLSSKLLVLIDGRAIYLSTLSAVLWDQQLVPVEDIQRIEVVRGPGATLWGANAVNGVINVVTKHAADTMGGRVDLQGDNLGGGRAFLREGLQVGEDGAVRFYVHSRKDRSESVAQAGVQGDVATATQAGFRYDREPTDLDAFTLQGDVQTGSFSSYGGRPIVYARLLSFPSSGRFSGANVLGRWSRKYNETDGFTLQAYWDHVERKELGLDGRRDQLDIDFADHFNLGPRHAVILGAGYRWARDDVRSHGIFFLNPARRADQWYGAYLQDDISLRRVPLTVSLGAKIEHNDYTGVEFQPSARMIWVDPHGWSAWASVSRAVRTPSRLSTAFGMITPILVTVPAGKLDSERMTAYEIGWRGRLSSTVNLDVTAFRNEYRNLISYETAFGAPPTTPLFLLRYVNAGSATANGLELAGEARVSPKLTLKLATNVLDLKIATLPAPVNLGGSNNAGASPRSQVSLRSWYDITDSLEVDSWLRWVDRLRTGGAPSYTDLDLRVAWRPSARLELYVQGQNLLKSRRVELPDVGLPLATGLVQRRVVVGLAARR